VTTHTTTIQHTTCHTTQHRGTETKKKSLWQGRHNRHELLCVCGSGNAELTHRGGMCWSVTSSLIAACYGYAVSYYLHRRNYSPRDDWYCLFLGTFTTTQVLDAIFWTLKGDADDLPCAAVTRHAISQLDPGALNALVSRYVLPFVLFFQPITLTMYPSDSFQNLKLPYRVCTVLASLIPVFLGTCTVVWTGPMPVSLPTLLWGGVQPPLWLVVVGCLFWGVGAALFCRPHFVWRVILAIGAWNLVLLFLLDGSIRLISKLCFWCLQLSFFFLSDPVWPWLPPGARTADSSAAIAALSKTGALLAGREVERSPAPTKL
jgi:hypothetical protein